MTRHRLLSSLAAAAVLALSGASAAQAAATAPAVPAAADSPAEECSAASFEGTALLGPERLPYVGPVGVQLRGYQRTGGVDPQQFLAEYRDDANAWIYPPDDGYVTTPDGRPIKWVQTLYPGRQVDRYGSVYGSYLAPAGTSYAKRALPPSSLDSTPAAGCNYHDYEVLKPFPVDAGPIAAWFAQPGHGEQYQLDPALIPGGPAQLNVLWLLDNGYLREVRPV
ncbi:TNT domain-containing protein [Actinospica durhamensis]|uniref:TNT domain-containing protein n=1 Tax=Actinospica durhamensis TaxID=1508375 RepID=A0A941EHC1_9ACTN|nr:TNT domain-containing protein [Actinospica durhamensis]MBR7832610.1 TNT domain-containing protein [Actinospica durhamensis]